MAAALPSPVTMGWSGILDRNTSRWFLKRSSNSVFKLFKSSGSKLKMFAHLNPMGRSLAYLTKAGAVFTIGLGNI